MEEIMKQMMEQTRMLQEALTKQAQDAREDRERFKAQLRSTETKAREDRERAEERITALLASQTGTVPAQNGEQLLISNKMMDNTDFVIVAEDEFHSKSDVSVYNSLWEISGEINTSTNINYVRAARCKSIVSRKKHCCADVVFIKYYSIAYQTRYAFTIGYCASMPDMAESLKFFKIDETSVYCDGYTYSFYRALVPTKTSADSPQWFSFQCSLKNQKKCRVQVNTTANWEFDKRGRKFYREIIKIGKHNHEPEHRDTTRRLKFYKNDEWSVIRNAMTLTPPANGL
ncbi:hypothetical protein DdX_22399 [Ditylenchus destructor]|uniref:Uncharacterized protein n=1 Tax=Ditylenchus destructor TaxID=166010 RepID=A0AAD4MEA2_9BILA|nr:hypothetical protein DdX_22399 [Ditylenchus destructor]